MSFILPITCEELSFQHGVDARQINNSVNFLLFYVF